MIVIPVLAVTAEKFLHRLRHPGLTCLSVHCLHFPIVIVYNLQNYPFPIRLLCLTAPLLLTYVNFLGFIE